MEPVRRGRKPKGVRASHHVRFPVDHLNLYRKEAADQGLGLVDWIALCMARSHGLPLPDYLTLELAKAAQRREDAECGDQLRLGA